MRNFMMMFVLAGAFVLAVVGPSWAQDSDPIAVLKSDAGFKEKATACRELQRIGGKDAIPVLAPLLLDAEMTHMARYALEPMPYPEVGAALRDALGKTSGRTQIGIIASLEARKDTEAVPPLIALLADADEGVAQAAAKALGKIGTSDAIEALEGVVAKPDLSLASVVVVCNALLDCADDLVAKGQKDQAIALYNRLSELPNAPVQVRSAALRGTVLAQGAQGAPLLVKALGDDDLFDVTLRIAREMPDESAVTSALAGALAALPAGKKIKLIQTLGRRGDAGAGEAVMAEATGNGPTPLRVAALRALVQMNCGKVLELAGQLVGSDDAELAQAARDALSYYPGAEGDASLEAMLKNKDAKIRCVAVELIGNGGLAEPLDVLMTVVKSDSDESVRVAALKAVKDFTGVEEISSLIECLLKAKSTEELKAAESALDALCARLRRAPSGSVVITKALYGNLTDGPTADVTGKVAEIVKSGSLSIGASNGNFGDPTPGKKKQLRVDYTENGAPASKTVNENETLVLTSAKVPLVIVDAFCEALKKAKGENQLAVLRLLGSTGNDKALDAVCAAAESKDAATRETAQRALCDWPTPNAVPALTKMVQTTSDATLKVLALRGAVRLLEQSDAPTAERLAPFAVLMDNAPSAAEKISVLSGLAKIHDVTALEGVLGQFGDEAVRAEAVQAAVAIAKDLGGAAREDKSLFNGKDLEGWQGNMEHWRVERGAIVGHSDVAIKQTEYLWAPPVTVGDFYLSVRIKLEPDTSNSGIQFRTENRDGIAFGIQADAGKDVWARLYDQGGRGKLDWTDRGEKAVKPGEWNRYEILAIGPAIWTAINGQLGVACLDLSPECERSVVLAFQFHAGPPRTVSYKIDKLIHNPKVELGDLNAEQLIKELKIPE